LDFPSGVIDFLRRALEEDIGPGDCTTDLLIPAEHRSSAQYLAKSDFVLAGIPFVSEIFRLLDASLSLQSFFNEGDSIRKGESIAEASGKTSVLLAGERVSLNLLQRLSGIATLTRRYTEHIRGCNARIVDTRKTTPCLRFMEKYAVRIGGGSNHRFGLFDGILIKDNHIKAAGGIRKAVTLAKKAHHLMKIEIEVQTIQELSDAIEAGADIVMLDNMPVDEMKASVTAAHGRVLLEASGGVTLNNVRAIAETGVDFISVGALTHSAQAVDISMKITSVQNN
jgi:nicotinate-nucleotide pyrophosphorylase (carboxylating)